MIAFRAGGVAGPRVFEVRLAAPRGRLGSCVKKVSERVDPLKALGCGVMATRGDKVSAPRRLPLCRPRRHAAASARPASAASRIAWILRAKANAAIFEDGRSSHEHIRASQLQRQHPLWPGSRRHRLPGRTSRPDALMRSCTAAILATWL